MMKRKFGEKCERGERKIKGDFSTAGLVKNIMMHEVGECILFYCLSLELQLLIIIIMD